MEHAPAALLVLLQSTSRYQQATAMMPADKIM
jgi:hypothetical protein